MLGIDTWFETQQYADLERYRESIQGEQWIEMGSYEQMDPDNTNELKQDDAVAAWCQMGNSSNLLLILTGISNNQIATVKRHCWLSPFAIDTIEGLRKASATNAFYLFREPDHTSIEEAIPILILHLLSRKCFDMGGQQLALAAEARIFREHKGKPDSYEKSIESLTRLFVHAMEVFGKDDEVYIVLDRVDLCEDFQRNDLLRMMVDGMNNAACSVKVLVVTQGKRDWKPNEIELKARLRRLATLYLVARTQHVLSRYMY
jgi:hypothetical protein